MMPFIDLNTDLNNFKDSNSSVGFGTCTTASATAEKAVTLSGFTLATGATIQVTFTNANSAGVPTLNVNSTGAKAIYNEVGTAVSVNSPAYFPANSIIEFMYDGTNWVFKKTVVQNYVNYNSWYRVYSDGWIEQGSIGSIVGTSDTQISLLIPFLTTTYNVLFTFRTSGISGDTSESNINSKTTTYFYGISSTPNAPYWQASGY